MIYFSAFLSKIYQAIFITFFSIPNQGRFRMQVNQEAVVLLDYRVDYRDPLLDFENDYLDLSLIRINFGNQSGKRMEHGRQKLKHS